MALDSFHRKSTDHSKTLEQRAKDNGRAIDTQWIKENETNEFYSSNNLTPMPGGLDPDLQAMIDELESNNTFSTKGERKVERIKSKEEQEIDKALEELIAQVKKEQEEEKERRGPRR